MPEKQRMECFRQLLGHLAWIEHQFLSGIRDSRKPGSLWGMIRCVGGVRKSIHQSWLAKGLGLGLLCRGFKGVQVEIAREEASTLQIRSVAFPPGQCTSPHFHPCHRLFDQDWHQDRSSASLKSRPCSLWLLVIPLAQTLSLKRQLRRWKRLWQRSLTCLQKRPSGSCWNSTTSALQLEEITSEGTRVSCVYYQ